MATLLFLTDALWAIVPVSGILAGLMALSSTQLRFGNRNRWLGFLFLSVALAFGIVFVFEMILTEIEVILSLEEFYILSACGCFMGTFTIVLAILYLCDHPERVKI